MADVVVTIPVTGVSYRAWLRTSYISSSVLSGDGNPMIEDVEFGPDQEDALNDFLEEATREVLKVFMTRQGDATGIPFEYDGTNATYRFNEAIPLLNQASSIKSALNEDVKNAIFSYVTYLWFKHKGNDKQAELMVNKYSKLSSDIHSHIHRLHD